MNPFKPLGDGIFIGPQPTAADLDAARQQGIKTVIDLRLPGETGGANQALAQGCGLGYVNIPVDKEKLDASRVDDLDAALRSQPGPYLLHCATGARVALLLALGKARAQGWNSAQAFDWARSVGYDLKAQPAFAGFITQTLG